MESTDRPQPLQGEIWLTAFGAARIGEPGKSRPAIAISADGQFSGSIHDLVIMVPLSTDLLPTPTRPTIHPTPQNGLLADSVIVVRALRGMATSRLVRRLGIVDRPVLNQIQEILADLLDLS